MSSSRANLLACLFLGGLLLAPSVAAPSRGRFPITPLDPSRDWDESRRLQGAWSASFGQFDGERWSVEKVAAFRFTIGGDRYTTTYAGRVETGALRLLPGGGLDLLPATGPLAGRTIRAIYQVEDSRLVLCLAPPAAERPTDFTALAGSDRILIVLFR